MNLLEDQPSTNTANATSSSRPMLSPIPSTSNFGSAFIEKVTMKDSDANSMGDDFVFQVKKRKKKSPRFVVDSSDSDCDTPSKKLKCDKCSYSSDKISNMKRHIQKHSSPVLVSKGNFECPHTGCKWLTMKLEQMDQHLETKHGRKMEVENFTLKNDEELKVWMNKIQEKDFCKYISKSGSTKKIRTFYCHRSNIFPYSSESKGKRNIKKQGSIKSEQLCTSRLIVEKTESGLKVKFQKTHSGHSVDPGRVGLTSPMKRSIALQMSNGVPKSSILQNVRKLQSSEVNREGLTTMQDIRNVGMKFKIGSDVKLDPDDAKSLDITIRKLQNEGDSGVFFYKPPGVLSTEFPELSESDFAVAYMNNAQEHMLKTFGKDIICVDGTHGTNAYGFELSTVVVVDDQHQGFPVLFYYHASKSEETYRLLFRKLRERLGVLNCKTFMSDDECALYNAWTVMGSVERKLLCSWHVLKNWKKNLSGVEASLKKDVFSKLKAVMKTLDPITFEEGLIAILKHLSAHEALRPFAEYFTRYYINRTREWAYCYRIGAGINTNMYLESMHRDLKYNFFDGKNVKRMDASFAGVRAYLTSRQHDRLVSMNRGKLTTKDKALRQRHTRSVEINVSKVSVAASGCEWTIPSSKNELDVYVLKANNAECFCSLVCPQCQVCLHAFTCSCSDNSIKHNMCKHIHVLNRYLKMQAEPDDSKSEEYDCEQLHIDTNAKSEMHGSETLAHLSDMVRVASEEDIAECRRIGLEYVERMVKLVKSQKSGNAFIEVMKTGLATMERFKEDEPEMQMPTLAPKSNVTNSVVKQLRFMPSKKNHNATKHTMSDAEILKELILPRKILPVQAQENSMKKAAWMNPKGQRVSPETNGKTDEVSPFLPGRGGRTNFGSKLGGDSDMIRPAAGMISAQLLQRPGNEKSKQTESNGTSAKPMHFPAFTGSFHHAGNSAHEQDDTHAAGISSLELCHDEHEVVIPLAKPVKVRDTLADLLSTPHHPDHVIELEDDRESVASDASEFGYLATHQAKGKTVIRSGKLIHLARDVVDDSPPPAGVASLVQARSTSADILTGLPASPANTNGSLKVSGHGGRFCFRGGKLVKVVGEQDDKLCVAGLRTGELDKAGGRAHIETPRGAL